MFVRGGVTHLASVIVVSKSNLKVPVIINWLDICVRIRYHVDCLSHLSCHSGRAVVVALLAHAWVAVAVTGHSSVIVKRRVKGIYSVIVSHRQEKSQGKIS